MAKKHNLKATRRNRSGSSLLKQMRREGLVPAVIYGKGQENQNIKIDAKEFWDLLHHSASESILVNLDIEGTECLALIQDVQHDALKDVTVHVDFLAVDENAAITAVLPVEVVGEAPGVKGGGILDVQLHDLEVTCLPKDLPEVLQVDVSALDLGQPLHISEVTFPKGVTPTLDGAVVVALITEPRVKEDDEEEEETAELEVIKEKAAE